MNDTSKKALRRGHNEGNIRRRTDGRWEVRLSAGIDYKTGKPRRTSTCCKKRLEKERLRLEKAAAEAAREEERLQQEAQKIQTEKERLLSLDDKGLMVELILAVRGLYSQIEYIQGQQDSLSERSITGRGSAAKEQVAAIVCRTLSVERPLRRLDATDGMAVALCHYFTVSNPLQAAMGDDRVKGLGGGKKAASKNGSQSWEQFLQRHPEREIK